MSCRNFTNIAKLQKQLRVFKQAHASTGKLRFKINLTITKDIIIKIKSSNAIKLREVKAFFRKTSADLKKTHHITICYGR